MISEQELFDVGWRIFGTEDNDPYYKIILDGSVFGLNWLSGNFCEDGSFEIYSIYDRKFHSIDELNSLFKECRFKPNYDVISRYGSTEKLRE